MKKLFLILAFAALIAFSTLAYGQVIGGGGGEVITPGGGISAGDDIVPATSNAYDIGSATSWWKEAWITTLNVSGATINVGTSVFSSASINTWNTPARGLSANMLIDATASTDLNMNTNRIDDVSVLSMAVVSTVNIVPVKSGVVRKGDDIYRSALRYVDRRVLWSEPNKPRAYSTVDVGVEN